MSKQGRFLSMELALFEGHCKASVSAKTEYIWHVNAICLCRCLEKIQLPKKVFCISVCIKFGPNQNIIQRRCCHTVWWFNCSVLFFSMVWWGCEHFTTKVFTLWHFRLHDAVPAFFLSVILIPLWALGILVYSF